MVKMAIFGPFGLSKPMMLSSPKADFCFRLATNCGQPPVKKSGLGLLSIMSFWLIV